MPPLLPSVVARWAVGLEGRDPGACRAALVEHAEHIRAQAARACDRPADVDPLDLTSWLAGVDALALQDTGHDAYFVMIDAALPALADRPELAGWLLMRRARVGFLKGFYGRARADAEAAIDRVADAPEASAAHVDLETWPLPPAEVRADAQLVASVVDRNSGAAHLALPVARAVERAATARRARPVRLRARFQVACALQALERPSEAEAIYRGLFGDIATLGAERVRALVLANLGIGARDRGQPVEARAWGAEAIALLDDHGDRLMGAKVAALLGMESLTDRRSRVRAVGCEESRLVLELERAEQLAARGDTERARRVCDQIDWAADALELGWLRDAARARRQTLHPDDALRIDPTGFTPPGRDRVDLSRRTAPRLILQRLCEARRTDAGPIGADALVTVGWPGERMRPGSGLARVYTAIRTLRRAGLEPWLQRTDQGYALVGPLVHETSPETGR